ncbi:MAG: hypothetical protein EA381_01275 [Planctomycetaceae bacterium]|nr:MAG: hypothetical protein EA381_01275 [Planctomycetaceae bacterium]
MVRHDSADDWDGAEVSSARLEAMRWVKIGRRTATDGDSVATASRQRQRATGREVPVAKSRHGPVRLLAAVRLNRAKSRFRRQLTIEQNFEFADHLALDNWHNPDNRSSLPRRTSDETMQGRRLCC